MFQVLKGKTINFKKMIMRYVHKINVIINEMLEIRIIIPLLYINFQFSTYLLKKLEDEYGYESKSFFE